MRSTARLWILAAVVVLGAFVVVWAVVWSTADRSASPTAAPTRPASSSSSPDFGPNVYIFDEEDDPTDIETTMWSLADSLSTDEFGDQRAAVLLGPGQYDIDAPVGFYTTVSGTGALPSDVVVDGQLRVDGRIWDPQQPTSDDALTNFWRGVENLSIVPSGGTARWAVSQAAPMRRVHIRGALALFPQYGGPSSGGYLADSVVDGEVASGSQQQWYTRNSTIGGWSGGVWNQAFTGVEGAPTTSFPTPPYTSLATTPRSREKPFLYQEDERWSVFVPDTRVEAQGASWSAGAAPGSSIAIEEFLIARPSTPLADVNAALRSGRHLLLTPGVYEYSAPIEVVRAGTVVLGMGLATIVPTEGLAAIDVDDVSGVRLAGIVVDAGIDESAVLIRIGEAGAQADHADDPTSLHDVYVRIGGARAGSAHTSLMVHSDDVLLDHIWLWRADHGEGVGWAENRAAHGLVVEGDDVSALGLFVEHYQENQVVWNGERGATFFYQSELPYDPPDQASWMDGAEEGFASYRVADDVVQHAGWAMGVYSYFTAPTDIYLDAAITSPATDRISLRSLTSVFLAGRGGIRHVVNDLGEPVVGSFGVSTVPVFPVEP